MGKKLLRRCHNCHNCPNSIDPVVRFKTKVIEAVSLLVFLLICLQFVATEIRGAFEALWR